MYIEHTLSNRYGHFSGINRKVQFKTIKSPDPSHGKFTIS